MQAVVAAAMAVQTLLFATTAAPPAALFPSPTSARPFHRASNFRGASIRPSPPQRPSAASPVLPLAVEEDEAAAAIAGEGQRRGGGSSNRIQVSNTKKPLFFVVNLAKKHNLICVRRRRLRLGTTSAGPGVHEMDYHIGLRRFRPTGITRFIGEVWWTSKSLLQQLSIYIRWPSLTLKGGAYAAKLLSANSIWMVTDTSRQMSLEWCSTLA